MWKLNDKTVFRPEAKTARWTARMKRWMTDIEERRRFDNVIELRHIKVYADYFIITGGIHTRPQAPRIPGLGLHAGPLFHTARWKYDVTGGSPTHPCLTGLQGKRVGIIGTGATAVQVVPEVAKWASALYVFQRTPSAIHELGQTETDQEEWTTRIANHQGWQRERMINLNRFPSSGPYNSTSDEKLVNDSWTKMPAFSALIGSPTWGIIEPTEKSIEDHVKNLYALDQPRSDAARVYIDKIVHDGPTAEKLKVCIFIRLASLITILKSTPGMIRHCTKMQSLCSNFHP